MILNLVLATVITNFVGSSYTPDSTHFTTVQAAITAVPEESSDSYVIRLDAGTYREKVKVEGKRNNITVIGDMVHPENYVISWNDSPSVGHNPDGSIIYNEDGSVYGPGTGGSYTFGIYGYTSNFEMRGVTIYNSATDEQLAADGTEAGQAVALTLGNGSAGTPSTFRRCRIIAHQDTLCTYGPGYFEDCYVEGSVDFIFGGHAALFNRCELHSVGGYVAAGNHDASIVKVGYLFYKCRVTVEDGKETYLGRPWYSGHNVWWVDSHFGKGVKSNMYATMSTPVYGETKIYHYGCTSEVSFVYPSDFPAGVIVTGTTDDFWTKIETDFGYTSLKDIWKWESVATFRTWQPTIRPGVVIR